MEFPPRDVREVVSKIAEILRRRNQTLAVSEAACGGLLSAYLVSVPGASDFYIGGKLVYSLRQRLKLSGWSDSEISTYTGPSEQVALKLARTTKYELGSTYVLSETGFAGPTTNLHLETERLRDSSNKDVEVGVVYLGLYGPSGELSTNHHTHSTDRAENMVEFARLGLQFLLKLLQEQSAA